MLHWSVWRIHFVKNHFSTYNTRTTAKYYWESSKSFGDLLEIKVSSVYYREYMLKARIFNYLSSLAKPLYSQFEISCSIRSIIESWKNYYTNYWNRRGEIMGKRPGNLFSRQRQAALKDTIEADNDRLNNNLKKSSRMKNSTDSLRKMKKHANE